MPNTKDAYAAGLFDGEGTVTLSKKHKTDIFRVPTVSMSSTSYELLLFLKENYGGSISKHKTYKSHHKQSWSWKLVYNSALSFLKQILPYMREVEKIRRAKLLLNEYKLLTPRNGKYSKQQKEAKHLFETNFFYEEDYVLPRHPSNP